VNVSEKILIVDDDPALLRALPESLHNRLGDVEIHTASAVHDAVTAAAAIEFDCVLCDIRMPGTDGVALMVKLRELRPYTPVILMTGAGEDRLRRQALHAGASAFVTKPLDPVFLSGLISVVMQDAKMSRLLPATAG
jgi:DNA-binding NtrC family response regulator